jgi:hypothetical protein
MEKNNRAKVKAKVDNGMFSSVLVIFLSSSFFPPKLKKITELKLTTVCFHRCL